MKVWACTWLVAIESWKNRGRKFGSIFIILRQTHGFSILLRSFRNKYHEISQINISISPYTSVLGIYLLLNTSDLFLKHIRILTTAICNHTETSFAVLITIIYKQIGFSTQLITQTNCWSSQLLVYNQCRKKTVECGSSETNNRLDKVCVSFLKEL